MTAIGVIFIIGGRDPSQLHCGTENEISGRPRFVGTVQGGAAPSGSDQAIKKIPAE